MRLSATVVSTDDLRHELWGDPSIQGPWPELERLLHQRINAAIQQQGRVIVDATHARPRWRRRLIHGFEPSQPVIWCGWWLQTPLQTCLRWNQRRHRQVPEQVIAHFHAALVHPDTTPRKEEGFHQLHRLDPSRGDLAEQIDAAVPRHEES